VIYFADNALTSTERAVAISFQSLGIRERQDLQAWLINHLEVLGESLFYITSEFDGFDKSNRRLDLLLLDASGSLVVVEIKLDAARSFAEQQSIRYAAFCSTMTANDVISLLSRTSGISLQSAHEQICDFLKVDEFSSVNGQPRIILVAGSFQDQELTSTVMWLRKFKVDISCVEITPYSDPLMPDRIILVPKKIIPLPEASHYQVCVERQAQAEISNASSSPTKEFFGQIVRLWKESSPPIPGPAKAPNTDYMTLFIGRGGVHYEWIVRKRESTIGVALHFEENDLETNLRRLGSVLEQAPEICENARFRVLHGQWGKKWAHLSIEIPFQDSVPDAEVAAEVVVAMKDLVSRTLEFVKTVV
jgi:hypothetical protein